MSKWCDTNGYYFSCYIIVQMHVFINMVLLSGVCYWIIPVYTSSLCICSYQDMMCVCVCASRLVVIASLGICILNLHLKEASKIHFKDLYVVHIAFIPVKF